MTIKKGGGFWFSLILRNSRYWRYLGNPCGFIIKSGQMPRSEKTKSSCWTIVPHTPFCPCRLLNLSPTWGDKIWGSPKLNAQEKKRHKQDITRSNYLWSASLANYEINTQIAILVREEHCPIYHCCLSSQTTMFKWTWPILTGRRKEN